MVKMTELHFKMSTLLALMLITNVEGHGRLLDPISRASLWRAGFPGPPNYNDNQLFCGGVGVQYGVNGGKCGVCGDPWNGVREHEAGGKYALGIIVRKYRVGQIINTTVELTANHKGYFEFRLCPTDNPFEKVTQSCLDKYPLEVANTGRTRFAVLPDKNGNITVSLRLPECVRCRACLFQWRYNAGNSWGTSSGGQSCLGCGNQEQFYGCADIAIGYDEVPLGKPAHGNSAAAPINPSPTHGNEPKGACDSDTPNPQNGAISLSFLVSNGRFYGLEFCYQPAKMWIFFLIVFVCPGYLV